MVSIHSQKGYDFQSVEPKLSPEAGCHVSLARVAGHPGGPRTVPVSAQNVCHPEKPFPAWQPRTGGHPSCALGPGGTRPGVQVLPPAAEVEWGAQLRADAPFPGASLPGTLAPLRNQASRARTVPCLLCGSHQNINIHTSNMLSLPILLLWAMVFHSQFNSVFLTRRCKS